MKKNVSAKPELLAPAGDWPSLMSALEAGCDSVYFGVKGLTMRHLAVNFDVLELAKIMKTVHSRQRKGYLALNVVVFDKEIPLIRRILKHAKKAAVDAVICWDMAVIHEARKAGLPIHLSTQASVSNYSALKAYASQGITRIVLAREMKLADIKAMVEKIKKDKVGCQIETFIHGAMCVSVSGRCFLSEYTFSKSANRGACLQPCRRTYRIYDTDNECEYEIGDDFLLSPRDLCTLDFIGRLIDAGIHAFKIEGRIRSPEYVAVVTSAYRRAIDAYYNNALTKTLLTQLSSELSSVYNRGFSSGFYFGQPKNAVSKRLEHTHEKVYVGEVVKYFKKIHVAEIKAAGAVLSRGDEIVCYGKTTPASFATITDIQVNHQFVQRIEKGQSAGIKLPFEVKRRDKVFIWKKKIND